MKLVEMSVADLAPAPYNPRKDLQPADLEYQRIKRSIQEFDMVEPIVWNERTRRVVGGHHEREASEDRE